MLFIILIAFRFWNKFIKTRTTKANKTAKRDNYTIIMEEKNSHGLWL